MRSPETFGLIFFNILDIVVRRALRPRFARPRLAHHPSTRGADTFMLPSACTERARVAERSEATPRVEVGVDRLELSTFRLSSECSNQLSYTPSLVFSRRNAGLRLEKTKSGPDRSRTGSL